MKHDHHHHQQEGHDDSSLPLISNARVIEYLLPTMSQGIISMFPDSPCQDFHYSQSSIWSPLVHRHYVSSIDPYGGKSRGRNGKRKKRRSFSSEAKDGGCGCTPLSGEGWNKMMKAASRQFKKRKMLMRKDSRVIRVKLSNSKLDLSS